MSEVTQQDWADTLACKIRERSVRVGVIGLGYVGLSLAVEFAKSGLQVTGIEIDADKVARLRSERAMFRTSSPTR
jgi:UDP-N-acetyl-D-glucosamine dehydrogenase